MKKTDKKNFGNGYVSIMVVLFLSLVALVLLPLTFTDQGALFPNSGLTVASRGCLLYTGPNPPTIKAKSYWSERYTNLPDDEGTDADDDIEDRIKKFPETSDKIIDYQLRISNVPIFMKYISRKKEEFDNDLTGALHQNFVDKYGFETIEINGKKFLRLYPAVHGRMHGAAGGAKFRPVKFGLLYLAHLDANGKFIILDMGLNYVLVDVYQDPRAPAIPQKAIDECNDARLNKHATAISPGGLSLFEPDQNKSQTKKQLQLEYFLFTRGSEKIEINGAWTIHCKPAIYLYPPGKTRVNVKVLTKGSLTYTDPPYPDEGWNVIAYPDGKLYLASSLLPLASNYLYYESKVPDELIDVPNKGYTVSFSQLPNLYQTILPKLGLNEAQTKDFINYWTKTLPYSPYYFVGVMDQENINSFEPLEITPKPDNINRVRVYFKTLDKKVKVNEPVLQTLSPQPSALSKFSVTEWGGMFKNDPLHPFTCSQ